jgi:hypothetical protein
MDFMKTSEKALLPPQRGVDPEVLADLDILMRHLADKTPVDADVCRRVEERADRVIEELRQKDVVIDIEKLLQDAPADLATYRCEGDAPCVF